MYGEGSAFIGSGAMLSGKTNEDMGYPVMADFFSKLYLFLNCCFSYFWNYC